MSTRVYTLGIIGIVAAILVAGLAIAATSATPSGMDAKGVASVPPGRAYLDGQEIYFIHTEVSDAEVAKLLSGMMNSPVIHVPALSQVPASALADVYVFKNGVKGMGPLGFQPDVFDNPPGSPGYSPLRRLILVTWKNAANARELKSLSEIQAAVSRGDLTLEPAPVVINMPFITWPNGKR